MDGMIRWQKTKPYLMVLPSVVVVLALFMGGFVQGIKRSFTHAQTNAFTGMYYRKLLETQNSGNPYG